ncbi:hypothetical protein GOV10_00640 [Candidatus Woesearchaeota archaeon]|nr:hypothetical protein [Candidatus Woesearchaeota archaeon]
MELAYAAKQRLTNYEGTLMSVRDYLREHQIPVDKSRTVGAYKANPEVFPAKNLEEFLSCDIPAELEVITAEFGQGLRNYINKRYEEKCAKVIKQPKILAIKENLEDFIHFVIVGELIVRKELTNEDVAASYRKRSMVEMGEHMITVADKMLLAYFRWQYPEEAKDEERFTTLEDLHAYYCE